MRLPIVIGDYRLLELIGGGSFGTVYRAEIVGSMGFSQHVAVKVLDPSRARERPELVRSLADEAQLLSRISHPNIVQVRQFVHGEHDVLGDTYMMVMELVRGESVRGIIDHLVAAKGAMPVETVLAMLSEAADALAYAHEVGGVDGRSLGLVHRDLKPANLMVTGDGRLKILDFGIAWAAERLVTATATGMTKGTVLYMSPEQVRGMSLDGRSDIYCLGLIAFELLAGELFTPLPPGGLSDLTGVLRMVTETTTEERIPALAAALANPDRHGLRPELADPVTDLLARMLAEEPGERLTARGLSGALDEMPGKWRFNRGRGFLRALVREQRVARGGPDGTFTPEATRAHRTPEASPSDGLPREDAPPEEAEDAPTDDEIDAVDLHTATTDLPAQEPEPVTPARDTRIMKARGGPNAAMGVILMAVGVLMVLFVIFAATRRGPAPENTTAVNVDEWDAEPVVGGLAEPLPEVATPKATPEATPEPRPAGRSKPRSRPRSRVRTKPAATPAPAPTPEPRTTRPEDVNVRVRHKPPKVAIPGSVVRFTARLEGDVDACVPELHLAPAEAGKYARHVLTAQGGAKFEKSVVLPYTEPYARGVRYFLRCCDAGGTCFAGWRTARKPKVVRPPSY